MPLEDRKDQRQQQEHQSIELQDGNGGRLGLEGQHVENRLSHRLALVAEDRHADRDRHRDDEIGDKNVQPTDHQRPVALLVQVDESDHEPRDRDEELGERVEFRKQIDGVRKDGGGVMIEHEQHRTASVEIDQNLTPFRLRDIQRLCSIAITKIFHDQRSAARQCAYRASGSRTSVPNAMRCFVSGSVAALLPASNLRFSLRNFFSKSS